MTRHQEVVADLPLLARSRDRLRRVYAERQPSPAPSAPTRRTTPPAPRRPAAPATHRSRSTAAVYPRRPARRRAATAPYTGSSRRSRRSTRRPSSSSCATPDVAFLPKIAFSAFGIQDTDYLAAHAADKSLPRPAERHRPLQAQGMEQGQPDRLRGQPRLLGHQGPDAERRVPLERRGRPALPRARSPAPSTASTTRAPTTSPTIKANSDAQVLPARGPQHLLHRLQQHRRSRGTTRRSARRSPWASTASGSSTTSTPRAPRSRPTSRRARSRSAARATPPGTSTSPAAKALLAEAGFDDGFKTHKI